LGRRMTFTQERRAWEHFVETGELNSRKGRNKFNAEKQTVNGRVFDSTGESDRAVELQWLLQLGEIFNLRYQVRYEIIPKQDGESAAHYVADFVYSLKDGLEVVEDTKGHRTAEYRLKRKLMLYVHGIRILETKPNSRPRRVRRRR
jgi:hypothetical protein